MSNKIQANCNFNNRFNISYIKHLEKRIKSKYSELEAINQRILENELEFVTLNEHVPTERGFKSKNTYRDSNRKALYYVKEKILYAYQQNCRELRKAQKNLTIC